jgi:hypothetical protein
MHVPQKLADRAPCIVVTLSVVSVTDHVICNSLSPSLELLFGSLEEDIEVCLYSECTKETATHISIYNRDVQ